VKSRSRRRTKHQRRRRYRGGEFASAAGMIAGQNGQPAGMAYTGANISGTEFGGASYAPTTGGRRLTRRHRHRRRHRRQRGGTGGMGCSSGFGGESIGANAPGAAVYYNAGGSDHTQGK